MKQFQLESDTDDERHLLHQLEKYVQIQKKTNRIVHDDVVLDGFADGVVLALDDLRSVSIVWQLFLWSLLFMPML